MIELFITDIDGCLLKAMKTPEWETLGKIKSLNEQSEHTSSIPPLTICTGRPMPYAEAVAQWMGIKRPLVFENAGVFFPDGYQISVDGSFNEPEEKEIGALKKWLNKEIVAKFDGMTPEFFKLMDAGLIHSQTEVIQQALPRIRNYVEANHKDCEVHATDISINVILKTNNKRVGIQKLCKLQNVDPANVAYIGDSSGDMPGLTFVGHPFAPQNAIEEVKEVAKVMETSATDAVLEVYNQIVRENQQQEN